MNEVNAFISIMHKELTIFPGKSAEYWKLIVDENGNPGWQEDGNLNFDISEALEENPELLNEHPELAALIADDGTINFASMTPEAAQALAEGLGSSNTAFGNQTGAFIEVSQLASAAIQGLSGDSLTNFMDALSNLSESDVLVHNPAAINTGGLVNVGNGENPIYVPARLGGGQEAHDVSSWPGYRALEASRGITPHAGIDLRGIWDSDVVTSVEDSTLGLSVDTVYGLLASNDYELGGQNFSNLLGHLQTDQTIMDYISAFATEGVTFNDGILSGLPAGMTIGEVGNTGYSFGEHLDFRLQLNGKQISPVDERYSPFEEYFGGQATETEYARLMTGLKYNDIGTNFDDFWDRAWEFVNTDVENNYDYYMDYFKYHSEF